MNTRTYVVALLPRYELNESAKALNSQFNKYGLEFQFGDNAAPHTSLYMLRINAQHLDATVLKLSIIAKRHDTINLRLSGWRMRNRYLAAMYIRTDAVTNLQQDIVDMLNPLRAETHPNSLIELESADAIRKRNIQHYGWGLIGDAYDPHMTIARFLEEAPRDLYLPSRGKEFSGSFDKVALFEMGDSGTARNQIATFLLQVSK